jgi:MHS family proline/betaine transporter-like MFS transporter
MAETWHRGRMSRASIVIAAFSTIVEWYDFTLYLYFATVLSRVFFGGGDAALAATLAGFAVAYILRPVGAVIFAHVGDRYGRRRSLLLSVALITVGMFDNCRHVCYRLAAHLRAVGRGRRLATDSPTLLDGIFGWG